MEYGKTSRGGDMVLYGGYSYTKKKEDNGYIRWQCTLQRSSQCRGGMTTDNVYPYANPRSFAVHNHAASNATTDAMKCRSDLRQTVQQNVTAKTAPLVANALNTLDNVAMAKVGTISSIKRSVQREKAKHRPAEPVTLANINIQPPWTTTGGAHPVPFMFFDGGAQDPQRMFIYGTDDCLRHLSQAPEWFMDGNFKLCPQLFMQLYVIRARLDEGAISCVYAFLCGKAEINYTQMLTEIVRKCQVIGVVPAPRAVKMDFEMAAMNAVRNVFGPLVSLDGCFYHLCQNTWRHIQDLGLVVQYNASDVVKQFVGMMDGLAFLPVQDIDAGVIVVRNAVPNLAFVPLLQYFLETYVGVYVINPNNGQLVFQVPLFPPATWNVHDITLQPQGSRTNNICEGWNNGFREKLGGIRHPGLYPCIEGLQKDNAEVRLVMVQSQNGRPFRTRTKRNYEISQRSLRRACQLYQNGHYANNIQGYLERISHAIRF